MTLELASPHFLWLLLFLPVLAWLTFHRREKGVTLQFSGLSLFGDLRPTWALRARRLMPVLRLVALALLIVGLARPRFGTVQRDVSREGVDLFYCLDVSGTMRAEDFSPNRLEKAKELTAEMIQKRQTDRQGLVVFSGDAFVLCPLTFDAGTVSEFLKNVSFDAVATDGTAIGVGLTRALKKMIESHAKSRAIILMTDGDNNAGNIAPEQAMAAAKKMGVKIYTIGIGSTGETTAVVPTDQGLRRVMIRSTLNEELLQNLARETGGVYRRATSASELKAVLKEIDSLERSEIEMKEFRTYDERMAIFLWAGLALLAMEIFLTRTRFQTIP
ncbi:MAG TPA: VWA domain-containing protein [Candidatus Sumerlaeota bacterium]|nr:VWA domain-containing protein [Candidatus Sumerlaeota bacterium]